MFCKLQKCTVKRRIRQICDLGKGIPFMQALYEPMSQIVADVRISVIIVPISEKILRVLIFV